MRTEGNRSKRKPVFRALALVIAVALLCTAVVTQYGSISRLAAVLAEEDPLSRIYSILQDEIDEPQTYDDYYQLASIAIGQGDYEEALGYLDECEKLADAADSAAMSDLALRKASLYMLTQDLAAALSSLEDALEYDPDSSQALLLQAQIGLTQGDYGAAASGLEAYLGLVPDDAAVRQDLAQVYEALGRYADAAACYEAIYAQYPQQDVYHLEALRCQLLAGEYEVAYDGFTAYIEANEQTEVSSETPTPSPEAQGTSSEGLLATAYFLRASCQMQLAQYAGAAADFEAAIAHGYAEDAVLEQLVTCSYVAEDYEAVLTYGGRLLALPDATPSLGPLYQQMGAAAVALERYEEAVGYLTLSIEHGPELIGSYYYRGVSLLSLERYEEAVEDFTRSIEQGYLTQFCYYNRGVCYVQLLDYDSALDDMEMTLTSGDEQTLKDAATNILWQLAQYYETLRLQETDAQEGQPTAGPTTVEQAGE